MAIETVGAWGELLGGIAGVIAAVGVMFTLLYLARQIHQNTKSVQSSAYAACMQGNAAVHESHMAAVDVFPEYFFDRAAGWDLDSIEYGKFHGHATQVFMQFELVYLLRKDGTVDQEFFDARMRLMKRATGYPGLRRWWNDWGEDFYDARFYAYANQIISGSAISP